MIHTFSSIFEIYPDSISDGVAVIGYSVRPGGKRLSFPFTMDTGDAAPDEKGRYRASELGLIPFPVMYRKGFSLYKAEKAWIGNNLTNHSIPTVNMTLREIRFTDGVTAIGQFAFAFCSGLKSIELPEGINELGSHAFACCISLEKVSLPCSLTSVGTGAFGNCNGLKTIDIAQPESDLLRHSHVPAACTIRWNAGLPEQT